MRRDFWRDLYPISETQRRFARATAVWIYLPIGVFTLIALAAAAAAIAGAVGNGLNQWAQLATIILAAALLAAGFAVWIILLAAIGGLEDLLETMPFFTSRLRLRVVTIARAGRRTLNEIRRAIAFVEGLFSSGGRVAIDTWRHRMHGSRRGGKSNG